MHGGIEKTIDIEKILKDKMGGRAKFVPRFAVSWLKHIIHEDEVNQFLWRAVGFREQNGLRSVCAILT